MFNKAAFCDSLSEKHISLKSVSERIGVDPSTLYRKMNGFSDFTRSEVQDISRMLQLSPSEIQDIFFCDVLT